jgi:succinate dehydrogenase/fumarate reductase flavoprotein subunit
VRDGLANGLIKKADSPAELARLIGVQEETFVGTIARYNELVARGEDIDFGKRPELLYPIRRPPFYAAKFGPAMLAVTGGLYVDTKLRVVDGDFAPIPGLYAVGNVAGGLYGVDYPTIIPGNSHGRAVTWGYIAAESAVRD